MWEYGLGYWWSVRVGVGVGLPTRPSQAQCQSVFLKVILGLALVRVGVGIGLGLQLWLVLGVELAFDNCLGPLSEQNHHKKNATDRLARCLYLCKLWSRGIHDITASLYRHSRVCVLHHCLFTPFIRLFLGILQQGGSPV